LGKTAELSNIVFN